MGEEKETNNFKLKEQHKIQIGTGEHKKNNKKLLFRFSISLKKIALDKDLEINNLTVDEIEELGEIGTEFLMKIDYFIQLINEPISEEKQVYILLYLLKKLNTYIQHQTSIDGETFFDIDNDIKNFKKENNISNKNEKETIIEEVQ